MLESTGASQWGRLLPKTGAGYGKSVRQEKYQVRRTVRLRVNREAGKKVQRSSACETRSAILLLQQGFTDSNGRKRIYKRKQQPSISPLPISRVRKQSHSEKVNCVPRSKTAFKSPIRQAKPGHAPFASYQTYPSFSLLHKAPKYKLNCENEELLHQYRPNSINFASPGRKGKKK